jgi:hypothetical protein
MQPEFESIFVRMRTILQKQEGTLSVKHNTPGHYSLEGSAGPAAVRARREKVKRPMIPVAWVQIGKAYVSYHLMGLYGNAKMLDGMSKELISFGGRGTEGMVKTTKIATMSTSRVVAQRADAGLQAERRAFEQQRAKLMRRYAGQYVALSRGRVLGHDKDDEVLAARMYAKLGDTPFYIARLEAIPSVYEFPSPELAG